MSQMSGTEISKDKAMTLALLLESIASILETEAPKYFTNAYLFASDVSLEQGHPQNSKAGDSNGNSGKSAKHALKLNFSSELLIVIIIEKKIFKRLFGKYFFPCFVNLMQSIGWIAIRLQPDGVIDLLEASVARLM